MMLTLDQIADLLVEDMRQKLSAAFLELADEVEFNIRAEVMHSLPAALCMPAVECAALH